MPSFHLGDSIWQVWTYTKCPCLHCRFFYYSEYYTWLSTHYTFNVGRFIALLLCIFLIASGVTTVRPALLKRNWVCLIALIGGLTALLVVGLPYIRDELLELSDGDADALFHGAIGVYAALVVVVYVEAWSNSRVLKAQLLMIRSQGIEPTTTPAYAKFKLFTRLRRYLVLYFALHTFSILATVVQTLTLEERLALVAVWEIANISLAISISVLFNGSSTASGGAHAYLESELHMAASEVRRPLSADEVSLGWNDLSTIGGGGEDEEGQRQQEQEQDREQEEEEDAAATSRRAQDAESRPLMRTWREGMAVPPPPMPPALVSVVWRTAPRSWRCRLPGASRAASSASRRSRTAPEQQESAAAHVEADRVSV